MFFFTETMKNQYQYKNTLENILKFPKCYIKQSDKVWKNEWKLLKKQKSIP